MKGIAIDMRYGYLNTHFGFLELGHFLILLTGFLQVNPDMVASLEQAGLSFAAKDETGERMCFSTFCWVSLHISLSNHFCHFVSYFSSKCLMF